MSGYILESRTILDSAIWEKPPLYFKVWHYLLLKAQHADYKGLKRGQLITSIPEIREACSYYSGYRKEMPSKNEIWNILEWLRNPYGEVGGKDYGGGMIKTVKVTHGLLVTICNYNVYQDPKYYGEDNGKATEKTTEELRSKRQADNINKNDKNDKNEKNNISPLTPLIETLPVELQPNVWEFVEHRKQIKAPMTELALKKMLNKLNDLSGGDTRKCIAILDQSIANGWKGIFQLDEKKTKTGNKFLDLLAKEQI